MANSYKPASGATATLAVGVPVQPSVLLPDNTHTIVVYNSAIVAAYMGWAQDAAAFLLDIAAGTAIYLPAGTAMTLAINSISGRSFTPGDELWFDISAGAGTLYITYVNGISI